MSAERMNVGPVVLITGGASGIGKALGEAFRARGATVVLADVNPAVTEVARSLGGEGFVLDVCDREAWIRVVDEVEARLGPIDTLVNNAGLVKMGDARTLSAQDWERTLAVNLHGPVNGVVVVYPRMCSRGRGTIVQVASALGLAPATGCAPYVTSKHALVAMSAALRAEGARYGVKVVAACPGFVDTPLLTELVPTAPEQPQKLPDGTLTPAACAAAILRGLDRDRAVITMGWQTKVYWLFYRLFPEWLIQILGQQYRTAALPGEPPPAP